MSTPTPLGTRPRSTVTRREHHTSYAGERGWVSEDWRALGTSAHLVVVSPEAAPAARRAVEDLLERIDHAASRFRSDSELAAVNTAEGAWTPVSPLLGRALRVALDAAAWTDGLVDPTVGASLVELGYDRTFTELPADRPVASLPVRRHRAVRWGDVELDEGGGRVRVPAGTLMDLGATAKGLAADLAAEAAVAVTGSGVLVSLGGDIAVAGPPPGAGWPVSVADTSTLDADLAAERGQTIVLAEGGLATSSVMARRWRRGGSVVHHLIDPRDGWPTQGPWRTVSVAAGSAALANSASTAGVILGERAPRWLAERGLPARLVDGAGLVTTVAGWPADGEASR